MTNVETKMFETFYDNSAVRRRDRLLDAARAEEILRAAEYGVLSMTDGDGAYGVPVNYVWDGAAALYVHCAMEGRKLRAIAQNPQVSFCVVGTVRPIPENFTTLYESLVIRGRARTGLDDDERRTALRLLVRKFAPEHAAAGEQAIARSFHRTEIIRLDIESISGKAKASSRHISYPVPASTGNGHPPPTSRTK